MCFVRVKGPFPVTEIRPHFYSAIDLHSGAEPYIENFDFP